MPGPASPSIGARDIVKRFGPLVANDQVDLEAYPGQVLAVVGENGAGKSTLMNILSGLLQPDEGEILLHGKPVRFSSPRGAIERGIGMVHQHFMLIPKLTVAENVVLGHEPSTILFDSAAARRKVAELSQAYGLKLTPAARVESLPVGLQQRVEILKILYWGSEILIFDEPTAVLTPQETNELFEVLRDLAKQDRTIIFITHKLKEVMAISDRITVLRGGRVVGNLVTSETTPREIASLMIGREVLPEVQKPPLHAGATILEVRDLVVESDRGLVAVDRMTFEVRAGEIFGIAGVEGNGQTELVETLTGLRRAKSGTAMVNGISLLSRSDRTKTAAAHARAAGVSFVPEDRRERGLVLTYSVADNLILGLQDDARFSRRGVLRLGEIRRWAKRLIEQFDVRPPRPDVPVGNLSGGNQQKVVLAREFQQGTAERGAGAHQGAPLLVASQPTRGLDVGAAQFVHQRIVEKRQAGAGILLVSAELDEILALADRIAVLYEGQIMGIFEAGTVSENQIGLLMTGGEPRTEATAINLEAPALTQGNV